MEGGGATSGAHPPILTVANQLTLVRMALAPVLVVLVLAGRPVWALVTFLLAALTDLLDGLIARLGHQQTRLGAMLDPVADKLLLGSALVVLTWRGEPNAIPAWVTVMVLARDVITVVAVVVINLAVERRVYYPSLLGKAATVVLVATVGAVLLANALGSQTPLLQPLYWITVGLTAASAVHYALAASVPEPPA